MRGEIEVRSPLLELLTGLADDHPLITLATQQRAEALLADTVGRRGIDQIDAQLSRLSQQGQCLCIVGNGEAVGVLDALITTELDRAQAQRRNLKTSGAQRTMQIVQRGHGSNVSHTGWPSGGRGSAGSGA